MQPSIPPSTVYSTERKLTQRGVLWVGLHCDMRCTFCYDDRVSATNKDWITFDDAVHALDKFHDYYHNGFVDFMGGEPTLHPKILDIVRRASDTGLRPTIVTHGMQLADLERATAYANAGIHDFLVSIHGIGDTIAAIHRRGSNNFAKQMQALENLRKLGIPFRFNCTLIQDNLTQLEAIAELAGEKGARVVNFLTFNPYFEWARLGKISFQVRHSEIAPYLAKAIDKCLELGVEANVRYMPPCQLPGYESHVYTGFQLPYDTHEWDYNSWYDVGHPGSPSPQWYLEMSRRQQQRHHYIHVPACNTCAVKGVCDGFHAQYVTRWGGDEARSYSGPSVIDPCHFIRGQTKIEYIAPVEKINRVIDERHAGKLTVTQFSDAAEHRAGIKLDPPRTLR